MLVAVPVEHLSTSAGLFAKAWSGCSQQPIPSRKGAFHDISSTTHDRGHADPEPFCAHPTVLRPTSVAVRAPLQQSTGIVGTRADSCLSNLFDQRKEAGDEVDSPCYCGSPLPIQGDP